MILTQFSDSFPTFPNLHEVGENEVPTLGDDKSWIVVGDENDKAKQRSSFAQKKNTSTNDLVQQFNQREAEFRQKEDQDVAMFLSLVDRMSVKSLLFILQGHARSMHNSVDQSQLQKTLKQIEQEKSSPKTKDRKKHLLTDDKNKSPQREQGKTKKKKVKQFRFAMVHGQQVRQEVREIPHVSEFTKKDKATLWWSRAEQKEMQREAARVVRFFRDHRPEYIESVEVLANSFQEPDDTWVEYNMKKLTNNSFPRGLECHIVPCLGKYRDDGVQSVIVAQHMFLTRQAQQPFGREEKKDDKHHHHQSEDLYSSDQMWDEIRKDYVKASVPCQEFARLIAECDHVEALKACISRWDCSE